MGVQTTLDDQVKPLPKQVAPYSDTLFAEAAEQWLIATDQVCPLVTFNFMR
jgi:hypothetical protein